jgi:hypothetical protein
VVVGHGASATFLHRQAGLCAIEGLDLAFLIDAQDQRLIRRLEVEPDHVLHLGSVVLVPRNLEICESSVSVRTLELSPRTGAD